MNKQEIRELLEKQLVLLSEQMATGTPHYAEPFATAMLKIVTAIEVVDKFNA